MFSDAPGAAATTVEPSSPRETGQVPQEHPVAAQPGVLVHVTATCVGEATTLHEAEMDRISPASCGEKHYYSETGKKGINPRYNRSNTHIEKVADAE